ncbi:MAG: AraC family transcriptional regulator [Rhizobiaceae bacterium]|nr:AraC family transcriptional regulator [Rhizobiaceae bacterium]
MSVGENKAVDVIVSTTTNGLRKQETFAYFCDAICGIYTGIEPRRTADSTFDAAFSAYSLGDCTFAIMSAPRHAAERTRSHRATHPDDSLFLNFCDSSETRLVQHGIDRQVPSSQPLLIDNGQDFKFEAPQAGRMRLHSLRIDRDRLQPQLKHTDLSRINDAVPRSHFGAMLGMQMRLMCGAFTQGKLKLGASMKETIIDLIGEVAAESATATGARQNTLSLQSIKAVASWQAGDPGFGINALATALRVTPRTIQSRFAAADETFSDWLLEHRLTMAQDRLIASTGSSRQTIGEIAHGCGFTSVAHFHRVFRQRYGQPPGSFRQSILPGML